MNGNQTNVPKILYVTTHMPCPPTKGARLRVLNIGRQLKKSSRVTLVYIGVEATPQSLDATKDEFDSLILMITKKKSPTTFARLINKFKFHWPWYHTHKVSRSDRERFFDLMKKHDLVWFHTLAAADAFGRYRYDNSLVDMDDLAQIKYALKLKTADNLREKIACRCLMYKWARWEKRVLDRFKIAAVCSRQDKETLGSNSRICIIPNGYEMPAEKPTWKLRNQMSLGFIGHLEYNPNKLGLKWFGEKIWPLITAKIPNARLRIVGKIPQDDTFLKFPHFEPTGFIEDTGPEFNSWSAMIVPLQYGGGTRLKILDAFSKMCPVVSTPVGAYGLEVKDNQHLLIQENPESFANACIQLIKNQSLAQQLAQNAWKLFEEKYNWNVIGQEIDTVVNRMTRNH